jgi:hypothetical protein
MTDRELSSGAMTGATGDLTPDDSDDEFVPAERREMTDPRHQADVTAAQGRLAPAQAGDIGEPGEDRPVRGPTNLASRESGYGSEHGLSPNDPAYRMEARPAPARSEGSRPRDDSEVGGDEFADHEDHF